MVPFKALASPPPPVGGIPWGPHPPGHSPTGYSSRWKGVQLFLLHRCWAICQPCRMLNGSTRTECSRNTSLFGAAWLAVNRSSSLCSFRGVGSRSFGPFGPSRLSRRVRASLIPLEPNPASPSRFFAAIETRLSAIARGRSWVVHVCNEFSEWPLAK